MSADEAYELEVTDVSKFKALWTNTQFSEHIVKVTDLYVYLFICNDPYVCSFMLFKEKFRCVSSSREKFTKREGTKLSTTKQHNLHASNSRVCVGMCACVSGTRQI